MVIEQIFEKDIDRKINGVVQVEQDTNNVIEQELDEYVITKELKKHFITFFNNYNDAFLEATADIGVWISGFFGSGKSHFLKMLSYILENIVINGIKTVERFRKKFEDDPATFMLIDSATKNETETILFNIDIEGSINKDKTAVLRVFAKMFYNHLGFYGENLKVAKLEQFIDKKGKTEEFRRVFEEKNGQSWIESRDAYAFFEDDVVETLKEVLGMSETSARNWFDGTENVETSIAQLVSEIKEYVDSKPDNFRLLFMIDEAGQYIGGDTDMLLNLQSLVEQLGSKCMGKVWVVCTGQEAIDEIIKTRENEFSRIQARFKTRLSLTSSSADEVIQKRILKKKPEYSAELENIYKKNDSVLRNLFSFNNAQLDIKGYRGETEFSNDFPFVPYQFVIMQKVFSEIRKHGNSGKHFSGGERSMLSGFQEAAQKIKSKDEYALVPFYLFYDTVHSFLDSSIRRVLERCQRAADNHDGIEPQDVNVLKLLYLIRYIDHDIPSNIDNIVILMADDIRMDKITVREKVRQSLDRLLSQNYIGRTGDTYNFLTDEEQDIQSEIKNTQVDTVTIVERIASIIFGDIYEPKKFRYGIYDFPFDTMVDGITVGSVSGGMKLRFLTVATDANDKTELKMAVDSANSAVVILDETPYYETIESSLKILKYIKQRNLSQLPQTVQNIIRSHREKADKNEKIATELLKKAIENAQFYVDGERIEIKSGDAKSKIDQAMNYLVSHVYSELDLIEKNYTTDEEIREILKGSQQRIDGTEPNRNAVAKMEEYLEMQSRLNLPTSMADIQSRYRAVPYGWKEMDIASVTAQLIYQQKVTIKYCGNTIQPDNPKLIDMLHKKSEIGKTSIRKRVVVSETKIKAVKEILREYFDVMDVPSDEDGLVAFIKEKFTEQKEHFENMLKCYDSGNYPDKILVSSSISLIVEILMHTKDNIALIDYLMKNEDKIFDNKDSMVNIEGFFQTQKGLFDSAVKFESDLHNDLDYISKNDEAYKALNTLRLIITPQTGQKFSYKRLPELNGLMETVKTAHDEMLEEKRKELNGIVTQCMGAVHKASDGDIRVNGIVEKADNFYSQKKRQIEDTDCLAIMDGFVPTMWQYKDETCELIESALTPPPPVTAKPKDTPKKEIIKNIPRQAMFPAKTLKSDKEIDEYIEKVREQMKFMLKGSDGIKIN